MRKTYFSEIRRDETSGRLNVIEYQYEPPESGEGAGNFFEVRFRPRLPWRQVVAIGIYLLALAGVELVMVEDNVKVGVGLLALVVGGFLAIISVRGFSLEPGRKVSDRILEDAAVPVEATAAGQPRTASDNNQTEELMADVKWPAANADLLGPTKDLLEGVSVLENVSDINTASGSAAPKDQPFNPFSTSTTPYSLQVITAGSLAFSQQAAKIVTALGGSAAILAAIKAIWFTSGSAERAAIIAGAAAVLAAVFISLAIIVRSDVQARATAQAAEYEARARIASVFLQTAERAQPGPTPTATSKYWLTRTGASFCKL